MHCSTLNPTQISQALALLTQITQNGNFTIGDNLASKANELFQIALNLQDLNQTQLNGTVLDAML